MRALQSGINHKTVPWALFPHRSPHHHCVALMVTSLAVTGQLVANDLVLGTLL